MGDVNATDVAQETHLEILNDQNCVYHDGLLRYGRPFPSTSLLQGIYIDDGGIMKILPLVDILCRVCAQNRIFVCLLQPRLRFVLRLCKQ